MKQISKDAQSTTFLCLFHLWKNAYLQRRMLISTLVLIHCRLYLVYILPIDKSIVEWREMVVYEWFFEKPWLWEKSVDEKKQWTYSFNDLKPFYIVKQSTTDMMASSASAKLVFIQQNVHSHFGHQNNEQHTQVHFSSSIFYQCIFLNHILINPSTDSDVLKRQKGDT